MGPIELIGHVDAQHRLHVDLPEAVPPGPVKITLEAVKEAEAEEAAWERAVLEDWAQDWSDPREDIYTLEDGKPEDEPR